MGQAKERKARLGKWYGKPIGPGHPDFVPPKKPDPSRPLLRFVFGAWNDSIETHIDSFALRDGHVHVQFVGGYKKSEWPILEHTHPCDAPRGRLTIGSREFGVVRIVRYVPDGCMFLCEQSQCDAVDDAKSDADGTEPDGLQEMPAEIPQRRHPRRPRLPVFAMAALAMGLAMAVDFDPMPDPRKRVFE